MNAEELKSLIEKGETSFIQFKLKANDAYKIGVEMVAFSNAKGGIIIFGVEDKKGEIIGLTKEEIQNANQLIANAATDIVKSQIFVFTEVTDINDKLILIVKVEEGTNIPYFDNKGIIWMKNGSDKRKVVSKEEVKRLLQGSGSLFADETIVNDTKEEDLDIDFFKSFVERKTEKKFEDINLSTEQVLQNLSMLKNGNLTLSALLMFGKNPQKFKPTFCVHCISFFGNEISSSSFRDKEDPFTGNLKSLFEKTIAFLKRNLKKIQVDPDFNSRQEWEIPLEALQELLVNAFIHRDYFINSTIKVFIFDDRVEIISPGKLPNSLTIENIKLGTSIPRNPILFTNARYFLPFVGVGSGIPRAYQKFPELELINDTDRELFIAKIKRINNIN